MASGDAAIRRRFFEVMSLKKPLSALLEPQIMVKVIKARIRAARRRARGSLGPISPMPPRQTEVVPPSLAIGIGIRD